MTDKTLDAASAELATTTSEILKATSQAFPELAGKSFEYYVQFVYAQAVGDLAFAVLGIILTSITFAVFVAIAKRGIKNDCAEAAIYGSTLCLIPLAFFMMTIFKIPSYISAIIAPEGAVIQKIIDGVK